MRVERLGCLVSGDHRLLLELLLGSKTMVGASLNDLHPIPQATRSPPRLLKRLVLTLIHHLRAIPFIQSWMLKGLQVQDDWANGRGGLQFQRVSLAAVAGPFLLLLHPLCQL